MSRPSRLNVFSSILLSIPLACGLVVGCAPGDEPNAVEAEDQLAESQDELTAAAKELIGAYSTTSPVKGGFASLELPANGRYEASLEAAGKIECIKAPCVLPEAGTWNASRKSGGGYRLRIRPTGESSRWYEVVKTETALTLTRSGVTQTLTKSGPGPGGKTCGGIAGIQCGSNEECVDDPSDTCDPKHGGADCSGICKPKVSKKICGGIAGIQCGSNEECVDDPSDTCDPKHGGADCSGICKPKVSKKICGGIAGIRCGAGEECVDDPSDTCDPEHGGADCVGICQAAR